MLIAQQNTTPMWRRATAQVRSSLAGLVRYVTAPWFPAEASTLNARLRACHSDYEAYIKRRNTEAEAKERTIAALTNDIERIDDDITEVEVYADVLKRLLEEI